MELRYKLTVIDIITRQLMYFYTIDGISPKVVLYGYRNGNYPPIGTFEKIFKANPSYRVITLDNIRGIMPVGASTEDYKGGYWYDPLSSHGSFDNYGEYYGEFHGGLNRGMAHIMTNKYDTLVRTR
jgi:hypothetical protein